MLNIKKFAFNLLGENTYVVWNDSFCAVVDPGFFIGNEQRILYDFLKGHSLKPDAILLTHGHVDHIFGVKPLKSETGAEVYFSNEDASILADAPRTAKVFGVQQPEVDFTWKNISDGDILTLGDTQFKVLATPGHSPGSVCWFIEKEKTLFSGDTLFAGTIGRTDLDGGDYDKEMNSIMEKLLVLDGDVRVFPGHGPATSIAEERTQNPMFEPFNEPYEEEA